ncbi:MAG: NADH-quinone oxidoreductase subunit C [Pseudomonadota bacterium]
MANQTTMTARTERERVGRSGSPTVKVGAAADAGTLDELGAHLAERLGGALESYTITFGELTLHAVRERIVDVVSLLKNDQQANFQVLIDICGVDYPGRDRRFDVVYHFLSPRRNQRVRVKIRTDEDTPVPSIIDVFPASNWFEREAYDMYGILFSGHPDLRRLLTDYGFDGYPLRKDFPLTGFVEVRYDDEIKRVVYEPVKLMQEYRSFDFESPWEGTEYELPGDEKATH